MFVGNVEEVSDTKIYVADLGEYHALIYQMKVQTDEPNAMVLPIPTNEDVEFINLSEYEDFFKDLGRMFPHHKGVRSRSMTKMHDSLSLEVVEVGDYIASFVPTADDFSRLDERFHLSDEVVEALPYEDSGFAVFQLKENKKAQDIHPMAYKYKPSDDSLFIPTVHVHNGQLLYADTYDHSIYVGSPADEIVGMEKSKRDITNHVDIERTEGLVSDDMNFFRVEVKKYYHNGDFSVRDSELRFKGIVSEEGPYIRENVGKDLRKVVTRAK
jgi:hypothetical protein